MANLIRFPLCVIFELIQVEGDSLTRLDEFSSYTHIVFFLLQDEARKKFREGDALKYLGFLEKAIGDGGKDGYGVSSSVSAPFDIMH